MASFAGNNQTMSDEAPNPLVSARMQAVRRRDTDEEMRLRRVLHRRGLRYRVDAAIPGIPRMRPDVVFMGFQVAVFVDGCFWHGCPLHATESKRNSEWWRAKIAANVARDRRHDEALTDAGWLVLRFWGHEDMEHAADVVAKVVEARRRSLRKPVRGRWSPSQEPIDEDDVAEIGYRSSGRVPGVARSFRTKSNAL